jgi:hypothetical protein
VTIPVKVKELVYLNVSKLQEMEKKKNTIPRISITRSFFGMGVAIPTSWES